MNASASHALTVEHVLTSSADLLAHALRNIQECIVKKVTETNLNMLFI